jgi:hypothetical protein
VTDSNTHAKNLLQLELDGGADLSQLVGQILGVRDGGREFSSYRKISEMYRSTGGLRERTFGKTGTEQTRNLLDQGFGCKESIVLLGELLDELLVLVKPLER